MADTGVLLIKSLDKGFVIHGDTIKNFTESLCYDVFTPKSTSFSF